MISTDFSGGQISKEKALKTTSKRYKQTHLKRQLRNGCQQSSHAHTCVDIDKLENSVLVQNCGQILVSLQQHSDVGTALTGSHRRTIVVEEILSVLL